MRKLACPSQEVSGNVTLLFLYSESYAVAVASFTGAWIETEALMDMDQLKMSLPSRERGLKHDGFFLLAINQGRFLHGSVD